MARIKRTDIYDYDVLPSFDDYVIGTDAEDSLRTKNYRIGDIVALIEGGGSFLTLSDTPADYIGQAGKSAVVNATEDGLEFITVTGGGNISDIAYGASWNSNLDGASKNALYDEMQLMPRLAANNTFTAVVNNFQSILRIDTNNYMQLGPNSANLSYLNGGAFYYKGNSNYRFSKDGSGTNIGAILSFSGLTGTIGEEKTYTYQDKSGTLAHLDDIVGKYYQGYFSTVSSAGGVETNVVSLSVPANTLQNDGDSLDYMFMILSSTTNFGTKIIRVDVEGETQTLTFDANAVEIMIRGSVMRRSSTQIFFSLEVADSNISDGVTIGSSTYGDVGGVAVLDLSTNTFDFTVSLQDTFNGLRMDSGYVKKN